MDATRIEAELDRIEDAAGSYAASADNPTGLAANYDEGSDLPWVIADDHTFECYATADEAAEAAAKWAAAMAD